MVKISIVSSKGVFGDWVSAKLLFFNDAHYMFCNFSEPNISWENVCLNGCFVLWYHLFSNILFTTCLCGKWVPEKYPLLKGACCLLNLFVNKVLFGKWVPAKCLFFNGPNPLLECIFTKVLFGKWVPAKCLFFNGPNPLLECIFTKVLFGKWVLDTCLC